MKRRRNKIIALLLASAMLTANIGMVSTFAAGEEKKEEGAQKDESEEKKEDGEKKIQTAAPTADVKEGTYAAAQKITLKSAAKDAVIYYTTDGKEPTEKSTRFDAKKPVQIGKTTTIKAIAVAKDTGKSKVVSFTYKIDENAKKADDKETPAAETAAPTEAPEQTPSATPASEPTMIPAQEQTQSEQGEAQLLPVSETEEKAGETPGAETTAIASGKMEQELENKISVGTSLETLNKTDGVKVTEGDFTVESIKWEATDFSTAIAAGGKYKITLGVKATEGFHFDSKTVFTFNGMSGKPVTPMTENDLERTYEFEAAAPAEEPNITPNADVLGGFKDGETQVELSYNAADRDQTELLQYCLGDASWETYDPAKKITLQEDENGECVVKARVVFKNGIASKVEKATETYKVKVARPTADIPTGTYNETKKVTLSTLTENAKIYYTLDGSDPDDKDILYNDPIEVKETTKIQAIAYDKDGNASAVAVFDYVIEKETPTATPTPTPAVKQITDIKVLDLDKPSRGAKPDRKATVSSDTHATVESVEWLKDNKGSDIEGVFKANTIYYAYVHLKAKDGYEFDTETFVNNSTTSNAKISNYSHNPGVKSASKSDVVLYVAWKTQAAATASAANNTITGLSSSYSKGATVTFTMNGAGANNAKEEGNERYVPVKYKISSSEFKFEDNQNPTLAKSFRISTAGTYTLTVTFQKQVYDAESGEWKNVDGETDTKTATVKINSSTTSGTINRTTTTGKTASSTSSSSSSSTSSKSKNAKTGDETPVGAVVTVFVLAGVAIVALVARKRKS